MTNSGTHLNEVIAQFYSVVPQVSSLKDRTVGRLSSWQRLKAGRMDLRTVCLLDLDCDEGLMNLLIGYAQFDCILLYREETQMVLL